MDDVKFVEKHIIDSGGFRMVERYEPTTGDHYSAILIRRDEKTGEVVETIRLHLSSRLIE